MGSIQWSEVKAIKEPSDGLQLDLTFQERYKCYHVKCEAPLKKYRWEVVPLYRATLSMIYDQNNLKLNMFVSIFGTERYGLHTINANQSVSGI